MREMHTPHRTFGIAADEENQELYLTVQHPPKVVVYPKTAQGEDQPIRTMEGPSTQLEDAHGISLDTKNELMYVSNHGSSSRRDVPGSGKYELPSITVYAMKATGDTAPVRIIEGDKTQLNWPAIGAEIPARSRPGEYSSSIVPTTATWNRRDGFKVPMWISFESPRFEPTRPRVGSLRPRLAGAT